MESENKKWEELLESKVVGLLLVTKEDKVYVLKLNKKSSEFFFG